MVELESLVANVELANFEARLGDVIFLSQVLGLGLPNEVELEELHESTLACRIDPVTIWA